MPIVNTAAIHQMISFELQTLRMWRQMGDTKGEAVSTDKLNELLDRIPR